MLMHGGRECSLQGTGANVHILPGDAFGATASSGPRSRQSSWGSSCWKGLRTGRHLLSTPNSGHFELFSKERSNSCFAEGLVHIASPLFKSHSSLYWSKGIHSQVLQSWSSPGPEQPKAEGLVFPRLAGTCTRTCNPCSHMTSAP